MVLQTGRGYAQPLSSGCLLSHSVDRVSSFFECFKLKLCPDLTKCWSRFSVIQVMVIRARQLDMLRFLEDISPLIKEASSVLTNWRGVAGSLCGSVLAESLRLVLGLSRVIWAKILQSPPFKCNNWCQSFICRNNNYSKKGHGHSCSCVGSSLWRCPSRAFVYIVTVSPGGSWRKLEFVLWWNKNTDWPRLMGLALFHYDIPCWLQKFRSGRPFLYPSTNSVITCCTSTALTL